MIFLAGSFFWILSLLAVVRLLCVAHESFLSPRLRFWVWGILILLSMCLLFRPHEDIFGGEDPGSYINSGITYGRKNAFFYVDPLLSQVPEETRPLFYYGHAGYGTTKDACLWVRDPDKAVIGPHFQPAYPLLVSVVTRLGGAQLALYVIPLFTLFMALALRSLALQCVRHRWAGVIVFLLFILNPLTLWHGRCARPEIIAGFMFFGGSALLLHAWRNERWKQWYDIIIGTFCVCFAPFLHITAFLLVIPTALVVAAVILHARDDFFLFPVCALAALMAFVFQTKAVTDYYSVGRFIDRAFCRPMLTGIIVFVCLLVLAGGCFLSRRFRHENESRKTVSLLMSAGLAAVTVLFFIVSYLTRDAVGSLPILGRPVRNYLYLTDLKAFVNMVSMPIALLTLAGWIAWITGRRWHRKERIVFALAVFPAIMLAGNIHNFMMTRYLHVAIIPMTVLSLMALVTLLPDRRWYSGPAVVLCIAICLLGLRHRSLLVTLTEHKGLTRFLKPFAEIVVRDNGILLCEYSRLAAPFEHFFGIPCLGLDNERRDDYTEAEQAWETIMRNYSNQPAFFMTPFQPPLSDRFRFTRVYNAVFQDRKLQQAYQYLPTRIREGPLRLALYRMKLKTLSKERPLPLNEPYVVPFDAGNMGLRRFANLRIRSWPIDGIELPADHEMHFEVPALSDNQTVQSLLLLIMTDTRNPSPPVISNSPSPFTESQFINLADNWWLLRVKGSQLPAHQSFSITALSPMFLADMIVISGSRVFSLSDQFPEDRITSRRMLPIKARWARANAQVLLPIPAGQEGTILMLLHPPEVRPDGLTHFSVGNDPVFRKIRREMQAGPWQWQVWPFRVSDAWRDTVWVTLETAPAWDSKTRGFPSDLGMLIGYIIVLPSGIPAACRRDR